MFWISTANGITWIPPFVSGRRVLYDTMFFAISVISHWVLSYSISLFPHSSPPQSSLLIRINLIAQTTSLTQVSLRSPVFRVLTHQCLTIIQLQWRLRTSYSYDRDKYECTLTLSLSPSSPACFVVKFLLHQKQYHGLMNNLHITGPNCCLTLVNSGFLFWITTHTSELHLLTGRIWVRALIIHLGKEVDSSLQQDILDISLNQSSSSSHLVSPLSPSCTPKILL